MVASWRDYLTLCKPRVVLLMLLCAIVGMLLAVSSISELPWQVLVFGILGIALVAGSAATVNHITDAHIDSRMQRTQGRPLAMGRIRPRQAIIFAAVIGSLGIGILLWFTNPLTAALNFASWVGYGFIYSLFLKHATPQNIVIGGLFGATPPLFGWAAVTNSVEPGALLLVMLIFAWTPPHFWALALDRKNEYLEASIPMLPVTHGEAYTKRFILLYTLLLFAVSLLPFVIKMSGWIYLIGAMLMGLRFLYLAIKLLVSKAPGVAAAVFRYSITYLMLIFALLLLDHYLLGVLEADTAVPLQLEPYS